MVSAAGLAAEATAAQHARDLGDGAAVDAALVQAELLVARVRACAEDGGPLEQAYLAHAEADHCRAVGSDQVERWVAAAAAWDALGRPYPAAIARWRQRRGARRRRRPRGRHRGRRRGDRDRGAARRGLAGRRAGEPRRPRAAAALTSPAATRPPATTTDEDPFGLTPRERQVLALVAAGATNREIGRQLYMAEKTASVHVSRILAKLDVRSRTEAAGVAHRLGLDAVVYRGRWHRASSDAARAAWSAVTPSSVASSAERGPSTSPARTRPGAPSSAAQSSSSGSRPCA